MPSFWKQALKFARRVFCVSFSIPTQTVTTTTIRLPPTPTPTQSVSASLLSVTIVPWLKERAIAYPALYLSSRTSTPKRESANNAGLPNKERSSSSLSLLSLESWSRSISVATHLPPCDTICQQDSLSRHMFVSAIHTTRNVKTLSQRALRRTALR